MEPKIAVIFTCFNRKEKSINCVNSLIRQKDMPSFDLYIYDDGSTDGTSDAIKVIYPKANIIYGTGNMFWTRGMHIAMKEAAKHGYDYYLMVNDDVLFYDSMWQTMMDTVGNGKLCGATGCTQSALNQKLTYSGSIFYHDDHKRYVGKKIPPNSDIKECDVANWNCFLITKEVVEKVGLIDEVYEHSFGDFDYSLRMRKEGISIYISQEYVGTCENNSEKNTYKDLSLDRRLRIKKILAPNGLPIKSWKTFCFRYYGKSALRNFMVPYIKFSLSLMRSKAGKENKV